MLLSLEMRRVWKEVQDDKATRITERLNKDEANNCALAGVKEESSLSFKKGSKVLREAF